MISRATQAIKSLNTKEKKAYTILTLSFLSVSILGIFALRPSLKAIAYYKKKVNTMKDIDTKLSKKITNLDRANKNYESIRDSIRTIRNILPPSPNQDKFIREMEFLAAKNNLLLEKLEFQTEDKSGTAKKIGTSMELSGKFENLTNFISDITNTQRLVNITEITINKSRGKFTQTIKGEIFYMEK